MIELVTVQMELWHPVAADEAAEDEGALNIGLGWRVKLVKARQR